MSRSQVLSTDKLPPVRRLLYTRTQTAEILACSIPTVIRLENAGRLTKVRLTPNNANAQVRHPVEQVHALAKGGQVDA
jgi:hypothetical protein